MFDKEFWKDLAERLIATAAEAALACIGTASMLEDIDPRATLSIVALAVLVAFFKALVKRYHEIHTDSTEEWIEEDEPNEED